MHLYDASPDDWTEIGWYYHQNTYEIYAFNSTSSQPWTYVAPTTPGSTIYVDLAYGGVQSGPWYLWYDYLWNGSTWQAVAYGWLGCPDACGVGRYGNPDADYEAYTGYNGTYLYFNQSVPVANPVYLSVNGTFNLWTPSFPTGVISRSGTFGNAYCIRFNASYYNWYGYNCA